MKEKRKQYKTPIEGETSKNNQWSVVRYEVYQDGFLLDNVDYPELHKDMTNPDNVKAVAQLCKDNGVSIVCYLGKPYKGCSIAVFKSSGNYIFLQKRLQDQAKAIATSDEVYVLTANIDDHKLPVYYVWDGKDTGYLLYTWRTLYKDDMEENAVDVFESFGIMANELFESLLDEAERF